jgi:hypothetical protein
MGIMLYTKHKHPNPLDFIHIHAHFLVELKAQENIRWVYQQIGVDN